jgi:tetratricopeptide (TPR) repeat protein
VSYAAYLWKMFWPAGLAVFYPFGALSPAVVLASVFLLLAMTFVAVRWTDRHPYLLVGWLWYLITLLPVIGIIKVGDAAMADRYTYITLTGPFIALAWGAFDLSQALRFPRTALAAASALVLSILILVTYTQVGQWRDGITLFRHTLSVTNGNYVAHYCLAMVSLNKKNYAEALSNLKSALGINPNYTAAYGGMGEALIYQNRFDEALHYTSRAIESQPQNEKLRNQAGFILIRQRRIDEAITQFETAVRLAPDYARAHNNLGGALMEKNRVEEAILQFETAIRLDPGNPSARENLKYALAQRKEVKKSGR